MNDENNPKTAHNISEELDCFVKWEIARRPHTVALNIQKAKCKNEKCEMRKQMSQKNTPETFIGALMKGESRYSDTQSDPSCHIRNKSLWFPYIFFVFPLVCFLLRRQIKGKSRNRRNLLNSCSLRLFLLSTHEQLFVGSLVSLFVPSCLLPHREQY